SMAFLCVSSSSLDFSTIGVSTRSQDSIPRFNFYFILLITTWCCKILSFFVLPEGFDPLALVEGFTPVEDNKGVIATNFSLEGFDPLALVEGFTHVEDKRGLLVTLGMLPDDVTVSASQTIFFLLIGVTATNFSLGL
nr:hypothetical protein [Tanacetum cinerariifolium]